MRTGICLTLIALCFLFSAAAQQMPYSGKRHSSSHGGYYSGGGRGYSHKGGLFRKESPVLKLTKKKKPIGKPVSPII